MSYKAGIPLLASFEDDVDDDDLTFENVRPPGKCSCTKRTFMFSLVLALAVVLVLALVVGVTVPVALLKSPNPAAANTGSGIRPINRTTTSDSTTGVISATTQSISMTTVPISISTSILLLPSASPAVYSQTPMPTQPPNTSQMYNVTTSVTLNSVEVAPSVNVVDASTSQVNPILSSALESTNLLGVTSTSYVVEKTRRQLFTSSFFLSPTPTMTPSPLSNENCTMNNIVCFSLLDDRQYRVVTLSNGLRALLVSDPNSNVSAAAMDVAAGSFNDPADYEGLAHFCEHMLFIGTHKYPQLNQYSNYVATHGGSDNAFTSTQHTNYHFYVEADYFSTAVDMFAHFFIDPLFSADSVMDEMNAVNAEHQKNLQSDEWKLWQLLKHVSNPGHPLSLFSTGSLETLNKSDTLEQLLSYFNSSYSANTVS